MLSAEFKPAMPASKWLQNQALNREAAWIGFFLL
jgi:hypothetical protein